jgi:hypothetical protein
MKTMTRKTTFFRDEDHHSRFVQAVHQLGKTWPEHGNKFDPEYGAALYILTTMFWESAQTHISRHGIDFEALTSGPLSTGERVLLKWVANLFNWGNEGVYGAELMDLDEANFALALTALQMRRFGYREEEGGAQ